jgi:hypothetical protein
MRSRACQLVNRVSTKENHNEIDPQRDRVAGAVRITHVRGSEHELLPQGGMLQVRRLLQERQQADRLLP